MPLGTKLNHKEQILKELYFQPLHTTEIFISLHKRGVSIGANSLQRRLTDLLQEGKVESLKDENHREHIWKLKRYYSDGQGALL